MLQHEWPWKQHATWKKPVTKDHRLWFYAYKVPRFGRSIEVENRLVVTRACYCCLAAHLCPTLCDPMHCSPPGSSVHVISQARILEWVAISFSKGSSRPRDQTFISCIGRCILYHCATWKAHCVLGSFVWDWYIYTTMYKIDNLMRIYYTVQETLLSALWWPK